MSIAARGALAARSRGEGPAHQGHELARRVRHVLFSPVFGVLDPRELVAWILEDALPVRFQVQVHKYVWGRDVQGV